MIRRTTLLLTTALLILCAVKASYGADYDPSRIVVRLRPVGVKPTTITKQSSGRSDFDRLVNTLRIERMDQVFSPARTPLRGRVYAEQLNLHDYVVVTVPNSSDPDAFLSTLRRSPDVLLAEFDPIVHAVDATVSPNDTYYASSQYALLNTGTQPPYDPGTIDADIDMDDGWFYTTGDSSIVLAIIDTGVDPGHPEFTDRFWVNPDEEANDLDDDGNGLIDDLFGWNFANDNNANSDDNGHGTHVAGIAAASGNNGIGIAGVNWNCTIMAIRVLDAGGSGPTSAVVGGIYYAANEGADVISLSLGRLGDPVAIEAAAVAYAESLGVIVVAAMGNDDVGGTHWPAAYDGVISVGATDSDDQRADPFCYSPFSGSNYGAWIDVCAPGDNVFSTYLTAFGSYANLCGTSMSTPHVSGLISLMLALRPDWTTDSVLHILKNTSDDQVGRPVEDIQGFDIYHGWGRINAGRALRPLALAFPPILTAPLTASGTEAEPISFGVSAVDSNLTTLSFSTSALTNAVCTDHGDGTATFDFAPDYSQEGVYNVEFIVSDGVLTDTAIVEVTVANGCQCPCHADPACSGEIDVLDVVSTIAVAFRNSAEILDTDCFPNPGGRTDVDCTGSTDVLDVVKLIDVAFRNGTPAFCDPCAL